MRIGVVIPFYQRTSGILARALSSIAAQDIPPEVHIDVIVVDDSSPVAAAKEMAGFNSTDVLSWSTIRQPNGGPGAARNAGLDWLIARDVDYVAFLDSDDEWSPAHLRRALDALQRYSADFYFSDHSREGWADSHFRSDGEVVGIIETIWKYGSVPADATIAIVQPGKLTQTMVGTYLSQTSTVVLRAAFVGAVRFDSELRHASEDRMFWIELASKGARICISKEIEVACGGGINMFFSSFEWDSDGILARLASQIQYSRKVLKLDIGGAREAMKRTLRERRRFYAYLLLTRALKRRLPKESGIAAVMKHDPSLLAFAPAHAVMFLAKDRRRILAAGD